MDLILERFTLAVGRVGPMTSPSSSLLMVFSTAVHKITTTEKQFNEFKNQLWYQSVYFHKKTTILFYLCGFDRFHTRIQFKV